jgi:hypothetical protein
VKASLRAINAALLISFLLCYLEWGTDQSGFIFQLEYSFFTEKNNWLDSFSHPLIIAPFAGQLLLIYNIIRKQPGRRITLAGIFLLGLLVLAILLAGIFSLNPRMILSTLPFIGSVIWFWIWQRKNKPVVSVN